jgi:hypothetical protein
MTGGTLNYGSEVMDLTCIGSHIENREYNDARKTLSWQFSDSGRRSMKTHQGLCQQKFSTKKYPRLGIQSPKFQYLERLKALASNDKPC